MTIHAVEVFYLDTWFWNRDWIVFSSLSQSGSLDTKVEIYLATGTQHQSDSGWINNLLRAKILSCVRSEADAAPQWNDALFLRYDRVLLGVPIPGLVSMSCPCRCPCPNNTALFEGADLVLTQAAQLLTSASNMVEPTNCFALPLIGKYGSKISPSVLMPIVQQIMY